MNRAKDYNIDTTEIVVSGESAGGHLALAAGHDSGDAGFTDICAGGGFTGNDATVPKVAAIINWYGITDVNDMLAGRTRAPTRCSGSASLPNRDAVAKSVSPLTYVRADLPPILSIQGDADPIVPYSQNVRLRDALEEGGREERAVHDSRRRPRQLQAPRSARRRTQKIREFLAANGLNERRPFTL